MDDWFRAEAELLHPTHMSISETDGEITVKTEVPGFNPEELKVSLEPRRLTISGKRGPSEEYGEKEKTVYQERCCSELFRVLELPAEVDASKTTATLKTAFWSCICRRWRSAEHANPGESRGGGA